MRRVASDSLRQGAAGLRGTWWAATWRAVVAGVGATVVARLRWLCLLLSLPLLVVTYEADLTGYRLQQVTHEHAFQLWRWEVERLVTRVGRLGESLIDPAVATTPPPDEARIVLAYFGLLDGQQRGSVGEARSGQLRSRVEREIERRVGAVFRAEGLVVPSPLPGVREVLWPPVSVELSPTPRLLIVSPRDRIAVEHSVVLVSDLTEPEMEAMERQVDSQGFSSLVVPTGGIATYPAMVPADASLEFTLSVAAHEWLHHYLYFHPLGQAYWRDGRMRAVNETLADMVGREVAARLLPRYLAYADPPPEGEGAARGETSAPQVDLQAELRRIRRRVDALLAEGKVEEAERFMEAERDALESRGVRIRKLNQAYFAFYGSYAEGGAAGESPIPGLLRQIREQSGSLGAFVRALSQVERYEDLEHLAGRKR
ncbi:MAG TPA: hypothetical protein VIN09_03790 [Chloroflexota bacterium]